MVFDSTTLFGSLRPAAPICCRHSVVRGLPFCFFCFSSPAALLYAIFAPCHVFYFFFFPQLSEWERARHHACARYGKLLAQTYETLETLHISNGQVSRPSIVMANESNKSRETISYGPFCLVEHVSISMCGRYMFWKLETSLLTWLKVNCTPVFFPWCFIKILRVVALDRNLPPGYRDYFIDWSSLCNYWTFCGRKNHNTQWYCKYPSVDACLSRLTTNCIYLATQPFSTV